jgi:hypothetical protein
MAIRLIERGFLLGAAFVVMMTGSTRAEEKSVVFISAGSTYGVSCSANTCTQPTTGRAVLNVTQLETILASSDVTLFAKAEIDINAEITWASDHTLQLVAPATLLINKPILVTGMGNLTIDFEQAGSVLPAFGPKGRIAFWNTLSDFEINVGSTFTNTRYYLVNDIKTLAAYVNSNSTDSYALADNYNAKGDGVYTSSPVPSYVSNFTGLNNTISNLSIADKTKGHYVGLFGEAGEPGQYISWIKLKNAHVHGVNNSQVGVVVGRNYETLWGVSSEGTVATGKSVAGGVSNAIAGGLVGWNSGGVLYSSVSGAVSGGQNAIIGGAVGENAPYLQLVGQVVATYSSAATVLDSGACTGCKIGAPENSAGGIVGVNNGVVEACYATGPVTGGPLTNLGGLIGFSMAGHFNGIVVSYSTGVVSGGSGSSLGGVIGFDQPSDDIQQVYWDTTTSGLANASQGAGNIANDAGISGLTTTQFQSGLPPGFLRGAWGQNANINGGLPYLLSNPPN